jgi:hypothetical protein
MQPQHAAQRDPVWMALADSLNAVLLQPQVVVVVVDELGARHCQASVLDLGLTSVKMHLVRWQAICLSVMIDQNSLIHHDVMTRLKTNEEHP